MSELEILIEFKKQLTNFFDELIDILPTEGDLVVIRLFLTNQIPIKQVMDIFIFKINENNGMLRKMVKQRDDLFFLEHNVFDELGKNKVNHFKKIWCSDQLDNENKKIIWSWIDLFISLSDKYSKLMKNNE
jgi:hypothetical protein